MTLDAMWNRLVLDVSLANDDVGRMAALRRHRPVIERLLRHEAVLMTVVPMSDDDIAEIDAINENLALNQ